MFSAIPSEAAGKWTLYHRCSLHELYCFHWALRGVENITKCYFRCDRIELLNDGNRWSAWSPEAFCLHWLCSMLWMWCEDDEFCFRTWLFWQIGMIKDVDTGTNLVCEDSRPNIRNGTPSQLIFHSHESDNREIERNIPVDKKIGLWSRCSSFLL